MEKGEKVYGWIRVEKQGRAGGIKGERKLKVLKKDNTEKQTEEGSQERKSNKSKLVTLLSSKHIDRDVIKYNRKQNLTDLFYEGGREGSGEMSVAPDDHLLHTPSSAIEDKFLKIKTSFFILDATKPAWLMSLSNSTSFNLLHHFL